LRLQAVCYRAHDPRWAISPTSGDGAAIRGARFNPKGTPALYLSLSIEGAIIEGSQGFGYKIHPLTICAYEVDCEDIADLTDENECRQLGIGLDIMGAAWATALSENRRPASWAIYDKLSSSFAGILVPSFANRVGPSVTNLVLWDWSAEPPHRVKVIDPNGRLPKNQKSWTD
jgi:RES domain-containing protein